MTRVLHVVPSVAPRDGGPSAAVIGMSRALLDRGLPVLVATTDADGAGHLPVAVNTPVDYGGAGVLFFRCQFSERWKYSLPLGRWLRHHVGEFDLVHVHAVFSYAAVAAGAACRRAGVPYVVRPLGSIDPWSLARHRVRKRAVLRLGADALLQGASRVHFTSAEEKRRAESALRRLPPGVVIPLGVPDDLFSAEDDTDREDGPLVTIGRLDPKKGVDLVIHAFHAVSGRHPACRLIVAGDGDAAYVRELQAAAMAGPAARRIDFVGWVDGERRNRLLTGARAFVLPSAQENFGLAIVEAMAAATPVIVAEAVDLADRIAARGAGWVTARSVEAVARALDESLSAAGECRARGRRAREVAEEYRWPSIAARLAELYADVVREKPMRSGTTPAARFVRTAER